MSSCNMLLQYEMKNSLLFTTQIMVFANYLRSYGNDKKLVNNFISMFKKNNNNLHGVFFILILIFFYNSNTYN